MRLIDADALEKDYRSQFESVYKHTRDNVMPSDFYIERKAAYDKTLMKMEMEAFFEYLQARPSIDAVEVVRCKDCLNRGMKASIKYCGYRDDVWLCMLHGIAILPDDYCSGGVKADAEVDSDD